MSKSIVFAIFAGLVFTAAAPAQAQVSFDGKKTAFHSTVGGGIPLPGPGALPVLGATIAKGKKKHVVTIDASITSGYLAPGAPWTISMGADVNGIPVDPSTTFPDAVVQDCSASAFAGPYSSPADGCTVSATFIFDIDAAELASPGCCVNMPLTVTLHGGTGFNGVIPGIPSDGTMAVRMEKKK